jgi:hypothetical protein
VGFEAIVRSPLSDDGAILAARGNGYRVKWNTRDGLGAQTHNGVVEKRQR